MHIRSTLLPKAKSKYKPILINYPTEKLAELDDIADKLFISRSKLIRLQTDLHGTRVLLTGETVAHIFGVFDRLIQMMKKDEAAAKKQDADRLWSVLESVVKENNSGAPNV